MVTAQAKSKLSLGNMDTSSLITFPIRGKWEEKEFKKKKKGQIEDFQFNVIWRFSWLKTAFLWLTRDQNSRLYPMEARGVEVKTIDQLSHAQRQSFLL